ncbi:MAG: phosphatase PAP2 family protein [Prevotella sp.]|nr:phosphatase PAP2 family protein [Prevotella sp.]MDE6689028.1 phosphatase PAP2 family protein [Prevotella sp.]
MTREKNIIYAARLVSLIFTPFYLPLVGLIALFTFSYLNLLPVAYRLLVLTIVYVFTILLPTFIIHLYRRAQGWSLLELGQKRRRMVPYGISIICYVACLWTLDNMHIYHFVSSIVVAALLVQVICAIVNVWWKISTHTAGIGGMAGALFVFAEYFAFNPVWWLCVVLFVAGILGTARIILRQHSLAQVVAGFLIGFVCAAVGIIFF